MVSGDYELELTAGTWTLEFHTLTLEFWADGTFTMWEGHFATSTTAIRRPIDFPSAAC